MKLRLSVVYNKQRMLVRALQVSSGVFLTAPCKRAPFSQFCGVNVQIKVCFLVMKASKCLKISFSVDCFLFGYVFNMFLLPSYRKGARLKHAEVSFS